ALRPERRHERARPIRRGIDQILAQPAGLDALAEIAEVERLDAQRRMLAPAMTRDAANASLCADQLAPRRVVPPGQRRLLLRIHLAQERAERFRRCAIDGHPRLQIGAHAVLAGQYLCEPFGLELAAHAGQRRWIPPRVAEIVIAEEIRPARG